LILDEVHERGLESDFSLALLLSAMTLRKDLKLIVMSATISTQKFSMYLGNALGMKSVSMNVMLEQSVDSVETPVVGAPVLFIPGFTYPVDEYYRGDYEDSVAALEEEAVYGEDSWMYVKRKGELDYGLLVKLLLTLVKGTAGNSAVLHRASGAILVSTATHSPHLSCPPLQFRR
jgi:HrpA-like RNA helicase